MNEKRYLIRQTETIISRREVTRAELEAIIGQHRAVTGQELDEAIEDGEVADLIVEGLCVGVDGYTFDWLERHSDVSDSEFEVVEL